MFLFYPILRRSSFLCLMYSKEEAAQLRKAFWTSLGSYMRPIPGAWHPRVNWLNYHTGIKGIFLRMQVHHHHASIGFHLVIKDDLMRQLVFDLFSRTKPIFNAIAGPNYVWDETVWDDLGQPYSRIADSIDDVNIMRKETWPTMISFFKPRLIALDAYWAEVRDGIEASL